ncbi:DNA-directed RNA polymerase [Megasphaera sp.]|uniref:DNA-directed RNA polymerase n=1 Tax=Megasphaera sp. TaxID=2023260 RepID=UPI00352043DF
MMTLEQQLELEKMYKGLAENRALQVLNKAKADGAYERTKVGQGVMNHLAETYMKNVEAFVTDCLQPKRGVQPTYAKIVKDYVLALGGDTQKFSRLCATLSLKMALSAMMRRSHVANNIGGAIGLELEPEVEAMAFFADKNNVKRFNKAISSRVGFSYRRIFMEHVYKGVGFTFVKHTAKERTSLGMQLLAVLVETTDFFVFQEVSEDGKTQPLQLLPTDVFLKAIANAEDKSVSLAITYVPTIIPPKPWTSMWDGGYYGALSQNKTLMRYIPYARSSQTRKLYTSRLNELDLSSVYSAVNAIQATAYRINKPVLDILKYYLSIGGGIAGLAETKPLEQLPRFPHAYEDIKEDEELLKAFKAHKKKMVEVVHKENQRKGKALRAVMILKTAEDFAKYESIWFPMNIDFRGRVYPIPTGLNPQGDDMTKSLLQYANPVPVSTEDAPDALKWLAIHGAGLAGHDKIPLEDRVAWVEENKQNILSSAENPLDFPWWQEQDKPWQFLAWTMEYKRALEYLDSHGTLAGFDCRCTIAYDGTCLGLQHYSCLLRDPVGGSAVNLIDHDKPSDIYREVSDKVLTMVKKDVMEGTTKGKERKDGTFGPGTKQMAEAWLAHGINRKVCKRPVMTLAYGSGQYGFADQIYEDTTRDNPHFAGVGDRQAAQYLAKLTWKAVQTTVVAAIEGMECLKKIATALAKADMPVEWVTPMGLPIQQMYLARKTESFRLRLGNSSTRYRIYVTTVSENEDVDRHKQATGVAPNFIHSLDATHLMMSINEASRQGCVNFSTVHDSFGTSLGEAARLRRIIRQELVKLYTEHDPLAEFLRHAEELLGEPLDIELPKKGSLDIKCILDSKFVFH